MSDTISKDELKSALREHTDEILGVMETFMHQVDSRFNKLEERMDSFDEKLDSLLIQ